MVGKTVICISTAQKNRPTFGRPTNDIEQLFYIYNDYRCSGPNINPMKKHFVAPFLFAKFPKTQLSTNMKHNTKHRCLPLLMTSLLIFSIGTAFAQGQKQVIHLAKLQIDPAQLASYNVELKTEIETAVRAEPGVLVLNAVADKNSPSHITILEIYADTLAYKAHLQSPHFKKYKSATVGMVKVLEVVDVVPIVLGGKKEN